MAKKEVKYRKDGLPKVPLSTFEKIVIVISVILVILTAATSVLKWGFSKLEIKDVLSSNSEKLSIDKNTLKFMDLIMPETVELENGDGIKFDVKLRVNLDFKVNDDTKLFDYLDMFNVYDWDDNLVENDAKIQRFDISGQQLKIMALMSLAEKLVKVKEIVNNVLVVLILLDIVAAIFISYFIWKRADDRREIRELQLREAETKRVRGLSEEEIKEKKKNNKKKKKKK